ncbi:MAG: Ryanodine receptor Ryr [Clostridia bacterium]|nr:Ryanodine receptor Ryr [Clostridia bacterium]
MKYDPKPIDTSDINLPKDLLALTEKIAENVHDVWAIGRIAEGWTYGEKKDADKKITPLLVPYSELPESEKEYDRNTALETVKLIIKMGYLISSNHIDGGDANAAI